MGVASGGEVGECSELAGKIRISPTLPLVEGFGHVPLIRRTAGVMVRAPAVTANVLVFLGFLSK